MNPSGTDESPIGVWLWIALIILVNAEWIGIDLWLRANRHEYLTDEFKEGLAHPLYGPLLCFLVAGTVAAFVWHMWTSR